jgi:hypothetical protein
MIKTQIQMPDELYRAAKDMARRREMSLAELVRRGIEYMLAVYPPLPDNPPKWELPKPVKIGWQGLSPEELRDEARLTSFEWQLREGRKRAVR